MKVRRKEKWGKKRRWKRTEITRIGERQEKKEVKRKEKCGEKEEERRRNNE